MIVCFGGGKGLSSTASALKLKGIDFAAIVSTIDNGGSTGELRKEFGIPAVGDFRRVVDRISASPMAPVMESRFKGHALGNIVLLELVKNHGFKNGLEAYRQLMGVKQEVMPQFLEPNDLVAEISGKKIFGEVEIDDSKGKVEKLWMEPVLDLNPRIIELLESADVVVLGPGSLYTSVIPHLIPRKARSAISKVPVKVFVSGIRNDIPTLEGFRLSDHVREIEKFIDLDYVVVQNPARGVAIDAHDKRVLDGDIAKSDSCHDPEKLGDLLCRILC